MWSRKAKQVPIMYKAIIFDFFGVIHSDPANRWFQKHTIERSGEFADIFKQVDYGIITMEKAYTELSRLSGQPVANIKIVFGQTDMIDHELVEVIKYLKNKYKIGLLSNAFGDYVRQILVENEIKSLFDEIVISGDVGVVKPNPEIFKIILEKLDTKSTEVIFMDDALHNVEAANLLGMRGYLFEGTLKLKQDLDKL